MEELQLPKGPEIGKQMSKQVGPMGRLAIAAERKHPLLRRLFLPEMIPLPSWRLSAKMACPEGRLSICLVLVFV